MIFDSIPDSSSRLVTQYRPRTGPVFSRRIPRPKRFSHRSIILWVGVSLLVAMLNGVAGQENTADGVPGPIEEEIRWLANRARFAPERENQRLGSDYSVDQGPLQPLAPSAILIRANRRHAEDLALTGTFQHESPPGSAHYPEGAKPWDRARQEGYEYRSFAENIAAGYPNGAAAHNGWFHSGGHRRNLLKPDIIEMGVGYHYLSGSPYGRYYSQGFGKPSGTEHFFTGTVFHDADRNETFSAAEALSGVELHLVYTHLDPNSGAELEHEHDGFDRSTATGSFAVPIAAIPDGSLVTVKLFNSNSGPVTVTLPVGYGHSRDITLAAGQTVAAGRFRQPTGRLNVGLRDVDPMPEEAPGITRIERLTFDDHDVRIHVSAPVGSVSVLEASINLREWFEVQTWTAQTSETVLVDSDAGTGVMRFYRLQAPQD